jgi:hypothetical protein
MLEPGRGPEPAGKRDRGPRGGPRHWQPPINGNHNRPRCPECAARVRTSATGLDVGLGTPRARRRLVTRSQLPTVSDFPTSELEGTDSEAHSSSASRAALAFAFFLATGAAARPACAERRGDGTRHASNKRANLGSARRRRCGAWAGSRTFTAASNAAWSLNHSLGAPLPRWTVCRTPSQAHARAHAQPHPALLAAAGSAPFATSSRTISSLTGSTSPRCASLRANVQATRR